MRTRTRTRAPLLITFAAVLVCCSQASPAGFWNTYRSDLILEKSSDQGPWGGSRYIHWAADSPGAFPVDQVLQFAAEKGWACSDPSSYSSTRMSTWVGSKGPMFPLFFGEPKEGVTYAMNDDFPRRIIEDSIIIRCTTGWMRVSPGDGSSTEAYGYIQISSEGTKMTVYHLWGEV